MASFVVIGADESLKPVVDEFGKIHRQPGDIISSGCIEKDSSGKAELCYKWETYGGAGSSSKDPVELNEALTNQIAQFKAATIEAGIAKGGNSLIVCIISNLLDEKDSERLKWVYEESCRIGGTAFTNVIVNIVVVAYDLKKPENVAKRPKAGNIVKDVLGLQNPLYRTHVLYLNNMDVFGAATNIDSVLLGRILTRWLTLMSSNGDCYSILGAINQNIYGLGCAEFQYDIEDLLPYLEKKTEVLLQEKFINNPLPPALPISKPPIAACEKIDLNNPLNVSYALKKEWEGYFEIKYQYNAPLLSNKSSFCRQSQIKDICSKLNKYLVDPTTAAPSEYEDCDTVYKYFAAHKPIVTEAQKKEYKSKIESCENLEKYLVTDEAYECMKNNIKKSPKFVKKTGAVPIDKTPKSPESPGCALWPFSLFFKSNPQPSHPIVSPPTPPVGVTSTAPATIDEMTKYFNELRNLEKQKEWWNKLLQKIENIENEIKNGKIELDNFKIKDYPKSRSLIDINMLKAFSLDSYVDKIYDGIKANIAAKKTYSIEVFIKKIVVNDIRSKYEKLKWDGSSVFVNENSWNDNMSKTIAYLKQQSLPFVSYEKVESAALGGKISYQFFSNNPTVPDTKEEFDGKYKTDIYIQSYKSSHMNNTLCMFQVLNIANSEDIADANK